jgi:hypothetical protein
MNMLIAGMEQPAAPRESKPLYRVISDASFGDEVGSCALQGGNSHNYFMYE